MAQKAFILRMNISGKDRVPDGLAEDRIMIGWSEAKGLIDAADQQTIRRAVQEVYHAKDDRRRAARRAGRAAGSLWRFLHGMSEGDLVVVPHRAEFYVAEVAGPACFDADRIAHDTAHFREVRWLNAKKSFPRGVARSNLRHRMGAGCRGTCGDATYVLSQIQEVIRDASERTVAVPHERLGLFREDLVQKLADQALTELLDGKMGERDFEHFLQRLFEHLKGTAHIVPRRVDEGADLIVEMPLGRSFLSQRIAIQAKYYRPPHQIVKIDAVRQLLAGLEAEDADFGLVITTSDFAEEAKEFVDSDKCDKRVELINGEYLARILVEEGLWPQGA